MFDDVPDLLVKTIKEIPAEERKPPLRYVIPAGLVIAQYIRKYASGPQADQFFDLNPKPDGSVSYEHVVRVLQVGETLFLLRSHPGFHEFCLRFQKNRDFRSTFHELLAARTFLRGGYKLHARPETGIKREDFDFKAVGLSETINVEVKALTAPKFGAPTIRNAPDAVRKQLPNDVPAIAFCAFPESWYGIDPNPLRDALHQIAHEFFKGSRRVNAVVFLGEQHWDRAGDGSLGVLFVTQVPVANPAPLHPISSLDFLFNVSTESPRSIVERNDLQKDIADFQTSEFFRWVDHLYDESA